MLFRGGWRKTSLPVVLLPRHTFLWASTVLSYRSMRPTTDQPTTNQATEQRVTVPEAATILGLSEDAVRSRLKRGTLAKEKGRDGTVFVVLGSDKTNDQPTT